MSIRTNTLKELQRWGNPKRRKRDKTVMKLKILLGFAETHHDQFTFSNLKRKERRK